MSVDSVWKAINEAPVEETSHGRVPSGSGWFVTNIADSRASFEEGVQYHAGFEGRESRFEDYGINVQWLFPGEANCMYHREDVQESILILKGEALLIVEDEERELRQWDFVHLPSGTAHVLVGAGTDPCAALFVGGRDVNNILYPVSDVAARHGASVSEATEDPAVAYAGQPKPESVRMPWPNPPQF